MSAVLVAVVLVVAAVGVWPTGPSRVPLGRVDRRRGGGSGPVLGQGPADLWSRWRAGRRRGPQASEVAELVEALVPVLRAGVDPAGALRRVLTVVDLGRLAPVVREAAGEAARGGPAGAVLVRAADGWSLPELALLGRAWALSDRAGTSLAEALALVAEQVRRREASVRALAGATAGPRSAMMLLVALPLAGPLLGLAFGLGPVALYTRAPASLASLAAGVGLAGTGWWWSRRMLRRAGRPARVR